MCQNKAVYETRYQYRQSHRYTAGATADEYEGILRVLAADNDVDAVLAIFAPPIVIETSDMEEALRARGRPCSGVLKSRFSAVLSVKKV